MSNHKRNTVGLSRDGNPGHRGGAGRMPEWLKEKCQKIVDREKLIEFFGEVAGGRVKDHKVVDGKVVQVPASLEIRLKYAVELMDRGFGKPVQGVEFGGTDGQPLTIKVVNYGTNAPSQV